MSRRHSRCAAALATMVLLAACADTAAGGSDEDDPQAGITTVSFRVWDEAAAAAYRESFDAFTAAHRDILVELEVVAPETYWWRLATDLDAGTAPDVFWTNTANLEHYAADGHLLSITEELGEAHPPWEPAVVDLYTHDDQLWGVPQMWDAVVLYYNTDLVRRAGVDPHALTWVPPSVGDDDGEPVGDGDGDGTPGEEATAAGAAAPEQREVTATEESPASAPTAPTTDSDEPTARPAGEPSDAEAPAAEDDPGTTAVPADTLLPAAQRLTLDAEGRTAAEDDFDPATVVQYGFNAEPSLEAVLLPFLAQAGATFQSEGAFAFDSPEGVGAIRYLADLVNVHHVAPPVTAGDGPDAGLEEFLDGRLALFQSGAYRLRQITAMADFEWGIAAVVAGPQGPVTVVDGVVAAGNAHAEHGEAVTEVLEWVGSVEGQLALASHGVALPGAVEARPAFLDYYARAGVYVTPVLDAAAGPLTPPPSGRGVQAGLAAVLPVLTATLAGERAAEPAVSIAQGAGNRALPPPAVD